MTATFCDTARTPCGYCRRCAIHDDPCGCTTVEAWDRRVEAALLALAAVDGGNSGLAERYRREWDRGLVTLEELEALANRRRPTDRGCDTFETLAARYEFVARKAAKGYNHFTGFKDSGDPAKPYGLSWGFSEGIVLDGLYLKDLEGLIH